MARRQPSEHDPSNRVRVTKTKHPPPAWLRLWSGRGLLRQRHATYDRELLYRDASSDDGESTQREYGQIVQEPPQWLRTAEIRREVTVWTNSWSCANHLHGIVFIDRCCSGNAAGARVRRPNGHDARIQVRFAETPQPPPAWLRLWSDSPARMAADRRNQAGSPSGRIRGHAQSSSWDCFHRRRCSGNAAGARPCAPTARTPISRVIDCWVQISRYETH